MTSETQTESVAKKDTQKLQRAIVDGLEDVKAQDIVVFNTEHLSPLFERVVVASGTSNRQTKALAASVRDAVRDAGFPKPRVEGEDNGEWIIVDCGSAVVHVMQPAIRQYYHLEELWGEKPVRLKLGAAKPLPKAAEPVAKAPAKKVARKLTPAQAKKERQETEAALLAPERPVLPTGKRAAAKPAPAKTAAPKTAAKKAAPKAPAKAVPIKTVVVKAPVSVQRQQAAVKKTVAKKAAAKVPAKKTTARKA
ncbi:ribosome silencing factor [Variovorax sp. HJSM1_2]|uniref:ribosome silencing factor n=1 Tax=Variovorax sp. HJSM1_2 TaxID=3366263 RepID=UPI003BCC9DFE